MSICYFNGDKDQVTESEKKNAVALNGLLKRVMRTCTLLENYSLDEIACICVVLAVSARSQAARMRTENALRATSSKYEPKKCTALFIGCSAAAADKQYSGKQ